MGASENPKQAEGCPGWSCPAWYHSPGPLGLRSPLWPLVPGPVEKQGVDWGCQDSQLVGLVSKSSSSYWVFTICLASYTYVFFPKKLCEKGSLLASFCR